MPGIYSSAISHSEQIRRLAGIADTIGAMLSVFDMLPTAGQHDALAVSASLADDLAQELGALIEEAQPLDAATTPSPQPFQLPIAPEVGPQPPFRYLGGTLGFHSGPPKVNFSLPDGSRMEAGVEAILRHVDEFPEPDRSKILFDAGCHYGITPRLMIDPEYPVTEQERAQWEAV